MVVGTDHAGLSMGVLLSQHNDVTAVDINESTKNKISAFECPINDEYIEKFFNEVKSGKRNLNHTATTSGKGVYEVADYVVISVPTDYDYESKSFNCTALEEVIEEVLNVSNKVTIVIKSTVPVGYTQSLKEKYNYQKILFNPEFSRETKALYDDLNPSRIIIGCDDKTKAEAVKLFANTYLTLKETNATTSGI